MSLTTSEKLARLRLFRTENVGPITFHRLISRFGSAEKALEALPDLSRRGGSAAPLKPFAKEAAEKEIESVQKYGARLLMKDEADYPALLATLEDAPPVITVMGQAPLLNKKILGVVGARNASLSGRKIAEDFSGKIGHAGYVIASGLARGIDTAAHNASLATGTVAVVAGGIDVIYPPENEKLYHRIATDGVIVAESPFGTEPIARHFPKRNRIISGLSLGVLVVEAAAQSGSLITARQALDQNREVFAVPGSPLDPRAEGANSLIRDGAHIATSAQDILHVLNSLRLSGLEDKRGHGWNGAPAAQPFDRAPDPKLYDVILECLSPAPVGVDDVIRAAQAPAQDVLSILLELELAGRIERHPGNKVSRI